MNDEEIILKLYSPFRLLFKNSFTREKKAIPQELLKCGTKTQDYYWMLLDFKCFFLFFLGILSPVRR